MLDSPFAGLLGTLVAAALVVGAGLALLSNFALESPGELLSPTLGSAVVVALVVATLVALGIGGARRRGTPYW